MSDDKNTRWNKYWEAKIENKAKECLWIIPYVTKFSDDVIALQERVLELRTALQTSFSQIVIRAFLAGLDVLEYAIQKDREDKGMDMFHSEVWEGSKLDEHVTMWITPSDIPDSAYSARKRALVEARRQEELYQDLGQILSKRFNGDREKFIEWCGHTGQNKEKCIEFLDGHTLKFERSAYTESDYVEFITTFTSDGYKHSATEIRPAMERNGMVKNEDDWKAVCVAASRNDLSGKPRDKGYWGTR